MTSLRATLRHFANNLPSPVKNRLQGTARGVRASRAKVRLASGLRPLSYTHAHERGQPIHRYYIDKFLRSRAGDIKGYCLEFENDFYSKEYGGSAVEKCDILHVDDSNPRATIVADLTKNNDIPGDTFDCIICTHVLHIIPDLDKMIAEMHRVLKPGGVLLVAVPHISMTNPKWNELWRFTPEGLKRVLAKSFGDENVEVSAMGNSLTACGEVRGLVAHEFTLAELDYNDPRFAVDVFGRAVKGKNSPTQESSDS